MVIDHAMARRFIATYMGFLGSLLSEEEKSGKPNIEWLVIARERYLAAPAALAAYRHDHPKADVEMLDAIATLKVGSWLYLKDTKSYSVLLDEQGESAYGVLGLTDRLRTLAQGGTGLAMQAGVFAMGGRWVCDGLLKNAAWLGSNLRKELNQSYQTLRDADRFSLGPGETP